MESRCTLPAAREQAGQTASAEVAVNSYAQALANSQADLVNRNLALSDENARLREVITTLRQDNAYLKQRLNGKRAPNRCKTCTKQTNWPHSPSQRFKYRASCSALETQNKGARPKHLFNAISTPTQNFNCI